MAKDKYYGKTLRKNFARHEEVMAMPNLLEIQKKSYQWFLDTGLREVFADVASIGDYAGNLELSFIDYSMDEKPKYDVEECKARDATYPAPMKVSVRLHNKETVEIKEQEIFMGDFPLMTHGGTFVINGAERVVVSQIVRSPGIYYGKEIDLKTDLHNKRQRISLKGEITSPINLPDECRFANRCFECEQKCRAGIPPLVEVSPNHFVACFNHGV